MLAFVPFASYQERNMGTYPLPHIILLLCATTSAIYLAVTFVSAGFLFKELWTGCVAGLSGIVFALISLEANKGDLQTQEYVTEQRILAGVAYAQGFLDRFFPGRSYFHRLESTPFLSIFHGFPTYVPQPGGVSFSSTPMANLSSPTTGGPAAGYYQRSSYTGYGAVNGGNNTNTPGAAQDRTALLSGGDV
ncbi:UNVERIFIED_CONTAM: hypothetical protein HDU68_001128 [Siphonaria sp. JEL0065]|nr:hypothetical protein HDU68_001128 [Siphonaria sp. JEL0065]